MTPISLEDLETLDACLERAAALYGSIDHAIKIALISGTLGSVMEGEDAAGGNLAPLWLGGLTASAIRIRARLEVAMAGDRPLEDAATFEAEHASLCRLEQALSLALATLELMPAEAILALGTLFSQTKTGVDAPDLVASLSVAARQLFECASPRLDA